VAVGTAATVKLAYSTSLGSDGFPSSPSFGPAVAVNSYGCARLQATGLSAHTLYYFAVADGTSGVMFGTTGSVRTLYAANTSGSYKIAQWSCQTGGKYDGDPAAWQSISTYGPDILIGQGDFCYAGGTYGPTTPVQKHIDKTYSGQVARIPPMNQVLANASCEEQISDHEVAGNGQYESSPGVYGPWADQLAIFQTQILAFREARPVEYADTSATPKGRYYFKDLFKNRPGGAASVRLFVLDERTMETSDGRDTDGPSKTKMGPTQLAWLSANLLSTGLNILSFESTGAWTGPNNNIDKWSNYWTEFSTVLAPILAGKPCDWWGGDRHMLAYLDHTKNTIMPGVDVMIASATQMYGLGVSAQELYQDASGTTQTFGYADNGVFKRQYGRITLADDNAGTITRTWTGYDAITDAAVLGPFTRTFSY
jgi:phosphodiesterase/alkaline phosphatase D-like protein